MSKALKLILVFLALAVAVFLAYKMTGRGAVTGVRFEQPESVKAAPVTEGPVREEVMITGEVKAVAEVDLAPKVGGRLMRLAVDEGAVVKAGEMVAALDMDVFQAQVDQARAAVEAARAQTRSAETARDNAEREFRRDEALFKQGTSPQASLDSAEAAFKVASSSVDVAKASLLQAQAALALAEIQLREATLYAPFDSVVSKKLLDVGAFVPVGEPVLTLVSIDTVKVTAGAGERYLADVQAGKTAAMVTVDALPARQFPATLFRVAPTIDEATRTAEVDIRIANPAHDLKPGMYARVTLVISEKPMAVLIPADALLGREGDYYVYALDESTVKRVAVETGLRGGQHVEIVKGPSPGVLVVTSGEGNLFDGALVAVEESHPASVVREETVPPARQPAVTADAPPAAAGDSPAQVPSTDSSASVSPEGAR